MSLIAFLAGVESGLVYAVVALGVYISFRVLEFPDLTADGSFPLGGAVCAVCMLAGFNPWLALLFGMLAGAMAGVATAWLHVGLKISQLLAGILVMTALYSVNLRVMGNSPNLPILGQDTIFTPFTTEANAQWIKVVIVGVIALGCKLLLDWFFHTEIGLAMRSTGSNLRMSQSQGIHTSAMIVLGMAISNALIALAGGLFVQTQGFSDVSAGIGTIVIGLAAVIIGEAIMPAKRMLWVILSVVIGAVLYKSFVQFALGSELLRNVGFGPSDLNLMTALLVVLVLILPQLQVKLHRHHRNKRRVKP